MTPTKVFPIFYMIMKLECIKNIKIYQLVELESSWQVTKILYSFFKTFK